MEYKRNDYSTPPPYVLRQPPPYFDSREYAEQHIEPLQLAIGTHIGPHPGTANADGLTIQAECSDIIIPEPAQFPNSARETSNPAEPIANYYLLTLILLVICGAMCNVAAFCCLVPALFSAAMVSALRIHVYMYNYVHEWSHPCKVI